MNEVAKRDPTSVLYAYLDQQQAVFKSALPSHISTEKFIRTVKTAAQINPELIACDRRSLMIACMRACQVGLLPDGQEGAIVAFKGRAQWLPMYQGLMKLFRQSGQFKHISAGIVYEGEEFDHWIDEAGEHFRHRPGDERDPKKVRRVYATATTKDGACFICDLSLAEVNKHKAMSRASRDDAPWQKWEQEMQRKTAIIVLSKLLPKSSDLDDVIRSDERASLGIEDPIEERRAPLSVQADTPGEVLDQFANAPDPGVDGPEPVASPQDEGRDDSPSAQVDVPADPLVAAYRAGVEAKAAGHQRRAVPGEYRDPSHQAELNLWYRGFDGKPMSDSQNDLLGGA